ncbi:MAG: hypothetical protein CYPHOPRED_001288 [Cyphobasidiales sp. Tagirdzhanova-0007]|nr:MAG: hypothetical protein CYPHOPRED_001288 [Cyphobasidiales sp. Tagirdzhanova-0007]
MSRSARGGGRGGGSSGRGGGQFATGSSLMGGLSFSEVVSNSKELPSAKLYPKAPLPDWQEPTKREIQSQRYMKEYLRQLRFSAYHIAIPEKKDESQSKYSDRFDDAVEELPSLASDEQKARMNMEFFPTQTWQAFYNKQARSAKRTKIKKDTNTFLGTEDNAEEGDVGGKEGEEGKKSGDEDEEQQEDFDDEEASNFLRSSRIRLTDRLPG